MNWILYFTSIVVFLLVCGVVYWIMFSSSSVFAKSKVPRYSAVNVASTEPLELKKAHIMIDQVTLSPGNRVLVKNQVVLSENGIYEVNEAYYLVRAKDMQCASQVYMGTFIFVSGGSVNAKTSWLLTVERFYYIDFPNVSFTSVINTNNVKRGMGLYFNENGVCDWQELPKTEVKPLDFNIALSLKPHQVKIDSDNHMYSAGSIQIPIDNSVQLGEYKCIVYTDLGDWCCTPVYIIKPSCFVLYEDLMVSNSQNGKLMLSKSRNNQLKLRYMFPDVGKKIVKLSVQFVSV